MADDHDVDVSLLLTVEAVSIAIEAMAMNCKVVCTLKHTPCWLIWIDCECVVCVMVVRIFKGSRYFS